MRRLPIHVFALFFVLFFAVLAAQSLALAAATEKWPASGRIIYRVYYGDDGLLLGRTTHQWKHAAGRYRMQSLVETTGMAALIKDFRYQQRSEGTVSERGLRPERYSVEQKGKPKQAARFDWKRGKVLIDRGDSHREAKIGKGDQDVLSLWHQLARVPLKAVPRTLTVVTNKAAAVSVVRDMGVETLNLPMGETAARHVAVHSDDGNVKVDLWLAEGNKNLPVRIRIEDSKGEILDQQAERIELGVTGPVW